MNIRIVVPNSPGLLNDSNTYKFIFEKYGFIVTILIINQKEPEQVSTNTIMYNYNLHLETIDENYLKYAHYNLFMPNQELFFDFHLLPAVSYILCKSKLALRFFKYLKNKYNHTYTCYYTKFTTNISSELLAFPIIKNPNLFIHFAGKSPFKNTAHLIYCWLKNKCFLQFNDKLQLHITCYDSCLNKQRRIYFNLCKQLGHMHGFNFTDKEGILQHKNLYIYTAKLPLNDYHKMITSATVSICPSDQEGYGHYINESRYFKTFILTVDAEPMNELVNENMKNASSELSCGKLIKVKEWLIKERIKDQSGFELFKVTPDITDMADKIKYCVLHSAEIIKLGENGRIMYDRDTMYFKNKMKIICNRLSRKMN